MYTESQKEWYRCFMVCAVCLVVVGMCDAAPEGQQSAGRIPIAGAVAAQQSGMTETTTLQLDNPNDGSKFYNNPVYDAAGKQVGMHNYTVDTEGNVLDDSYQRWEGKITGEGVYINYRSDNYRNGTKIIVGKDQKSTTYWWDSKAKNYTDTDPTGGKYSAMRFDKTVAAEQRRHDVQSGIIDLKTVYGVRVSKE